MISIDQMDILLQLPQKSAQKDQSCNIFETLFEMLRKIYRQIVKHGQNLPKMAKNGQKWPKMAVF